MTPLRELWRQRWLLRFFGRRALEKMYTRTYLGWLWVPLRPGINLALRIAVLGTLLGTPSEEVPYFLYALVGLTVWELFDRGAFWTTRSMELARSVMRRVYVPRLTVLLGALAPASVYFGMHVAATILAVAWFAIVEGDPYVVAGIQSLAAVGGLALAALLAVCTGAFLAPLAAVARDVRFILVYSLGFWFFLTPALYPADTLDGALGVAVTFNPMTAPIELVRYGLLGVGTPDGTSLAVSLATTAVMVPAALLAFGRAGARTADAL